MKKQLKSLLLITLLVGMTASAWAQSSTEGKEFWVSSTIICSPETSNNTPQPYIAVSAENACTVKIQGGVGNAINITQEVTAGSWNEFGNPNKTYNTDPVSGPINVQMDASKWYPTHIIRPSTVCNHAGEKNMYGLHITATENISVYVILRAPYAMDASNILPMTALGAEYYTQDYKPEAHNKNSWSDNEGNMVTLTTILGTEDGTKVDITPDGNTFDGHRSGSTYTIELNKGQTYYLISEKEKQLAGTHIVAQNNRKIAVFTGSPLTRLPNGISARDGLFEQTMPVDYWGTQFIVTRSLEKNGNLVGITATEPETVVKIDGKAISKKLQMGDTYYMILQSSTNPEAKKAAEGPKDTVITADVIYIETSCPCAVFSYDTGNGYKGKTGDELVNGHGDPSSVWVAPLQQSIEAITFGTCYTNKTKDHFLNIVTETATCDSTKLVAIFGKSTIDKTTLLKGNWIQVPKNPTYSYVRVKIGDATTEQYSVFHLENKYGGFIATVYGNGEDESYAYSAGSSAITQGVKINGSKFNSGRIITDRVYCLNTPISFDAHVGTDNIVRVDWNFGDGITEYNGEPQTTHEYTSVGWFDVTADLWGNQVCAADEATVHLGTVALSLCVRSDTTYVFEHDCKDADYEGELEDEIVIDDDTCYSIKVRYISWGKHSKRDELITREDIFVDEYTGETYTENAEYDVNLTELFGTRNSTDCDSIIHRVVKILTCIDLQIPNDSANQHACQGKQLYIPYTQTKGERNESYAKIDNKRIDIRFDDYDVILPVEDLKPGRYKATIYVYDAFCDSLHTYPIDFAVFYPENIFIYKFGNVMAVLNQANNGGYDFRGYQWYLNGELVEGATSAVYQVEGTFAKGDLVYVNLKDKDGVWLPSCPKEVTEVPDFTPEANNAPAQKLLLNDQMVIRKDNQIFNIFGQRVQ